MTDTISCPSCGSENEVGRKFCGECGNALAQVCPSCGTANSPTVKFCGECGTALAASATPAVPTTSTAPAAERRLVSVLFADLVGFTTLSESRDPEEVRELLSRYFDTCRRLIELYGGTVEKFIGDAVMAVWGTPTATEDDAERAVRAALDLVAAVSALGDEVGASELAARAGVLTGEAAVTLGAEGQGMVAGDLVNTAARIQSLAEPSTVWVGDATRRATDQTIAYTNAGTHELKGKAGLVELWQAMRVVSGARGALKSAGLEAPFVGRDRELKRIKDVFHTCADERKPHLISITGIAGIGKSRLAWEFYKYFDGLPQITYWHRGRCLSYGEGVTYWALAAESTTLRAEGDSRGALTLAEEAVAASGSYGTTYLPVKLSVVAALEAAYELGASTRVRELLADIEALPPGARPRLLEAHRRRFLAKLTGDAAEFAGAEALFRELSTRFWLAVTLLEHADLTGDMERLEEARRIFEDLRATPWLKRIARADTSLAEVPA